MQAELIVVSGSLAGERFPLGPGDTRIGRAPSADIQLTEAGTAWEHCVVRSRDGRYHIVDRRTGAGPLSMECALANTGSNPATR